MSKTAMKNKKTAFTNSSTGYGKSKHHRNIKSNKSEYNKNDEEKKLEVAKLDDDKNLNSGFGDYLRSPEAVEMMKLFVMANTIMLLVTLAWPNMKEHYYMLMQWLSSFRSED
ncbi:uncharacterized protein LOC119683319 [Teleopsis dalmanni]|uniref:uncharacterized protein LOC119683319 n=1 Tax=Teleopsis dalmanni TaxID=139649 RepID=UPI0018CE9BB1|nr:uncharacterized protein LOC119683319 [Teleopsis dalmanni]